MKSLVSIIIPCYNAERWVGETIQSALDQTYSPIEIIVIDDGSTDDSLEVIKSFGNRLCWESGQNRGGNCARNRGFELSRGKYVQFLDADDYLLPQKTERQVAFLERTGADAVYGDCRFRHYLHNGFSYWDEDIVSNAQEDILESLLADWWVASLALLYRRDVVERCGGWDESLKAGQDRDFFTRIAIAEADIRYQPGCHSVYRRQGNTTISTSNPGLWLENQCRVLVKCEEKLIRLGKFSPKYRRALAKSYFWKARSYYDIDRSTYYRLLEKTLLLDPTFKPHGSAIYRMTQRIFGYSLTEKISSTRRQIRNKLTSLKAIRNPSIHL